MPDDLTAPRPGTRHILTQAATLAIVAAFVSIVLVGVAHLTRDRIAHNEQAWIQQRLDALIPRRSHDNDLLTDTITVTSAALGTTRPVTIYRARRDGQPVAAVIASVAPDGYRGAIDLLVAVDYGGTLIGVQVIRHQETPGLGDQFERDPSWLRKFHGLSLSNPPQARWTVRQDGGAFDAFTGATITPRAIVKAVRSTLEYYQSNRQRLFRERSPERSL